MVRVRMKTGSNYVQHSYAIQNGEDLCHYGTAGMKWYQRLYQNKDGSLTPLGREHYGYKARRNNTEVNKLTGRRSLNIGEFNKKEFNKSVNNAKSTARVLNKYADKYERAKYKKKLSEMSDAELEREIQKALPAYQTKKMRQKLEQRYEEVVGNPNSTKSGRDKALTALEIVGDVAIVASSTVIVADAVKKLISK